MALPVNIRWTAMARLGRAAAEDEDARQLTGSRYAVLSIPIMSAKLPA